MKDLNQQYLPIILDIHHWLCETQWDEKRIEYEVQGTISQTGNNFHQITKHQKRTPKNCYQWSSSRHIFTNFPNTNLRIFRPNMQYLFFDQILCNICFDFLKTEKKNAVSNVLNFYLPKSCFRILILYFELIFNF